MNRIEKAARIISKWHGEADTACSVCHKIAAEIGQLYNEPQTDQPSRLVTDEEVADWMICGNQIHFSINRVF